MLSKDQTDALYKIDNAMYVDTQIILTGSPGTGKTYLLQELKRKYRCTFTATTHKAVSALQDAVNADVITIHSLLALIPRSGGYKQIEDRFQANMSVHKHTVLVIDEASMVDKELYKYIPIEHFYMVIFVGDVNQLPPVHGTSYVFKELNLPTIELTTQHRQGSNPAMMNLVDYFKKKIGTEELLEQVLLGFGISKVINGDAIATLFTPEDSKYVAFTNCKVNTANRFIAKALGNPKAEFRLGDTISYTKKGAAIKEATILGSRVNQANNQELRLDNGINITVNSHPIKSKRLKLKTNHLYTVKHTYATTVHRCIHPDTLTITDQGMLPIKWINPTGVISTYLGDREYSNKVKNPVMAGITFTCENGLNISVKSDHLMKIWKKGVWVKVPADKVPLNSWFRVKLGGDPLKVRVPPILPNEPSELNVRSILYRVPTEMTEDLAEFMGIMVADGTIHRKGSTIRILKSHEDFIIRSAYLITKLFGYPAKVVRDKYCNAYKVEVHSQYIAAWLTEVGGMSPNRKSIPKVIMYSDLDIQAKFLRGLFEDGTVNLKHSKVDHIELSLEHHSILVYCQQILLRLGIVSTVTYRKNSVTKNYLYIYGQACRIFRDKVGFITAFKQSRLDYTIHTNTRNRVPVTKEFVKTLYQSGYLNTHQKQSGINNGYLTKEVISRLPISESRELEQWHYVRVKGIQHTAFESMCVTVPDSGSFLQNGQDHSNCQGSTYSKVFVNLSDICECTDYDLMIRLLYVALSRAKDNIYIIGEIPDRLIRSK